LAQQGHVQNSQQQGEKRTYNFNHFLEALIRFGPSRVGSPGDRIDGVRLAHHGSRVVNDEFQACKLGQHHQFVGQTDRDFIL
jgi:hypothetical protein